MTNMITSHTINQTSDDTTVMMPGVEAPLSCSNMGDEDADRRDYPQHTDTDHLQHTDTGLQDCQAVRCREHTVPSAVEGNNEDVQDAVEKYSQGSRARRLLQMLTSPRNPVLIVRTSNPKSRQFKQVQPRLGKELAKPEHQLQAMTLQTTH